MTWKLYKVTNGYVGESEVRCLVLTYSAPAAIRLARPKFEAAAEKFSDEKKRADYAKNLFAEVLCEDAGEEWAGEVTDG